MLIRKLFKFNNSHIVRNCTSERCKYSIHCHTYTVEVFLEGEKLDNGQMLMDFGIMKGPMKDIFKAFDGSYSLWEKESQEFKDFIYRNFSKVIELPFSPSAEKYAQFFFHVVTKYIQSTEFANGEDPQLTVKSVRVHETKSGYAECGNINHTFYDSLFNIKANKDFTEFVNMKNIITCNSFEKPYKQIKPEQQIL